MVHPSIHHEIRLSLSQHCDVRKKKPPLQLISSGQRAPHSFGVESPPPIETWCHRSAPGHDAADRVAKAASDGFVLVEVGEAVEFVAATAACGGRPSACRPTRFTNYSKRTRPLSLLPSSTFCSNVRQHAVSVGLRRSCARRPKLPPASSFVPARNPVCCHGHHSMDMQMTSNAEWHVNAVLHGSSSFKHCCIFGLFLLVFTATLPKWWCVSHACI